MALSTDGYKSFKAKKMPTLSDPDADYSHRIYVADALSQIEQSLQSVLTVMKSLETRIAALE